MEVRVEVVAAKAGRFLTKDSPHYGTFLQGNPSLIFTAPVSTPPQPKTRSVVDTIFDESWPRAAKALRPVEKGLGLGSFAGI